VFIIQFFFAFRAGNLLSGAIYEGLARTFTAKPYMYTFLVSFHSGWRWILLLFVLIALVNSFLKWRKGASWTVTDQKWNLYAMSAAHLQLLVGFALYFMSPRVQFGAATMKDTVLRFYTVEHILTMLIAVVLITLGYIRSKRAGADLDRFRLGFWFFLIGLIVMLAGIPWPFREALGGKWF
jgi:hypothetical protein